MITLSHNSEPLLLLIPAAPFFQRLECHDAMCTLTGPCEHLATRQGHLFDAESRPKLFAILAVRSCEALCLLTTSVINAIGRLFVPRAFY